MSRWLALPQLISIACRAAANNAGSGSICGSPVSTLALFAQAGAARCNCSINAERPMNNAPAPGAGPNTLPVILSAAAVQGLALYGLNLSVSTKHWPGTDPAWLVALYALAVVLPLTVQLLAEHIRERTALSVTLVIGVAFTCFGWHYGGTVAALKTDGAYLGESFSLIMVLGLMWLLILPFVQCRLLQGRWRPSYSTLFTAAWRNTLTLGEAVVFTGLFWLLLGLWGQLFEMLGNRFFKELFGEDYFLYPITALVFGFALYMIGSLTRLVSVVLEQVLSVLKWLAVLAGLILGLFTVALALKLPGLVQTGARAIAAAWLLWLAAVMVLLVNAAYRDGSVERPYPRWIALALRGVVPLLTIIALAAIYAMYLRVGRYGLTVERFWGCVVAAAVAVYAFGYAYAAVRRGPWMAGIDRINIGAALFLIAVIALAQTPVLSPYRLAAASQFERAKASSAGDTSEYGYSALAYLRFESGVYGRERLMQLADLQDHPRAAQLREAASQMLARKTYYGESARLGVSERLATLIVYPATRAVGKELADFILSDLSPRSAESRLLDSEVTVSGLFVDLNGDGSEEFALLSSHEGVLYARSRDERWYRAGKLEVGGYTDMLAGALKEGAIEVREPKWRTLHVGSARFRVELADE
jgi:hypothetical protein